MVERKNGKKHKEEKWKEKSVRGKSGEKVRIVLFGRKENRMKEKGRGKK